MYPPVKLLVTVLSLGLLWASTGWADSRAERWQVRRGPTAAMPAWEARPAQSGLSLSEAIARAQSRFPGKVVKAENAAAQRAHSARGIGSSAIKDGCAPFESTPRRASSSREFTKESQQCVY